MNIKLNKPFAANSAVDEFDVKQVKKALNRLGYYQPYEKTGITGIPDADVFSALKSFQKDQGLQATGTARPGDETVTKLSSEAGKKKSGKYIWRAVGDNKVRDSHAALDGTVRDLADSPDPGEEFNCRCWAEPIDENPYPDAIKPVYPELFLIPALRLGRIFKILREILKYSRKKDNYTDHAALRSNQRSASQKDIEEAIKTAKEAGNVITKTGKYGTPQKVYKGSNGLTVIEETQGRNAGKIITLWWN
ncbi:MAG: phage minor head protein [Alphaproteobacteria bacterium]|nr:phage minor head protein [Alphaproteobacteria bacterium]